MEYIELRKLIGFGKATFSITLPKKWITKHKLAKGDQLSIVELPNGLLEVAPSVVEQREEIKEVEIAAHEKDVKELQREIISAYINGYTMIHIVGDISGKVAEIRGLFQELVALEVMEVSARRITAKVFSDVAGTNIEHLIRRINLITKTMLDETKQLFESNVFYKDIKERDYEINRQSFFGMRILTKAMSSPDIANTMNLTHMQILYFRLLIEKLENIADRIKALAVVLAETDVLTEIGEEGKNGLLDLLDTIGENYDRVMKHFFKKSKQGIDDVFVAHQENTRLMRSFTRKHKNVHHVPLMTEFLSRTSSLTENIGRIVVDMEIKE